MRAAFSGSKNVIKLLKAELLSQNHAGRTALMQSVFCRDPETASLLKSELRM